MDHIDALKLRTEAYRHCNLVREWCYGMNRKCALQDLLLPLLDTRQQLVDAGELKLVSDLNRATFNILMPDYLEFPDAKGHKKAPSLRLKDEELLLLTEQFAIFPASLVSFLREDPDFNRKLIDSAARTDSMHSVDERDYKGWALMANQLAKMNDAENWLHIITQASYFESTLVIPDILESIQHFTNIPADAVHGIGKAMSTHLDYVLKNGSRSFSYKSIAPLIETSIKHFDKELANKIVKIYGISKIEQKNYAFLLKYTYRVDLDLDTLRRDMSDALSFPHLMQDKTATKSFLVVMAETAPECFYEQLNAFHARATSRYSVGTRDRNYWIEHLGNIIKLIIDSNKTVYEQHTISINKSLIDNLTGLAIRSLGDVDTKKMLEMLDVKFSLDKKSVWSHPEFNSRKKGLLENDLSL